MQVQGMINLAPLAAPLQHWRSGAPRCGGCRRPCRAPHGRGGSAPCCCWHRWAELPWYLLRPAGSSPVRRDGQGLQHSEVWNKPPFAHLTFCALPVLQVRFAMWDKVLVTPPPASFERGPGDPGGHIFARAAWRFARCLALAAAAQRAQQAQNGPAAQRSRQSAEQELQQLREEVGRLPPDLRTRPGQGVGIYRCAQRASWGV